ncbi:uncharacterized protein LOC119730514 [Patiria miniata]|nr:uncharacterized protein LOC119730514 [Patiria miniata]
MPDDENEESLEAKRSALEELFNQHGPAPSGTSEKKIDDTMSLTYFLLRQHINNKDPVPSISELKQKWPFLFVPRCFFAHFKCLTGIEIVTRLYEAFQSKGKRIQGYMEHQNEQVRKQVKNVLADIQSALPEVDDEHQVLYPGVILLMMAYFEEPEDSLFMLADVTATAAEIEALPDLPNTPRLIMKGNSILTALKWMLCIEGKVVCASSSTDFMTGLAFLFGSYYILNLEYQAEAATTLEFIQRCFMRINPESGSKCTAKGKSKRTGQEVQRKRELINCRVATFVRKLADHEWTC